MFTSSEYFEGPMSIRYPRGRGVLNKWQLPMDKIIIGKASLLAQGKDIAILSLGHVGNFVHDAIDMLLSDGLLPAHYDMRFLSPIDEEALHIVFTTYNHVITVEDGTITGGLGSAVNFFKNKHNYSSKLYMLGVPHRFITHGAVNELYNQCGYDTEGIVSFVKSLKLS